MESEVLTPDEEIRLGDAARHILENEVFKGACKAIEDSLASQRQSVPLRETEMHTRLIVAEQLWTQLRRYIEQTFQTGEFVKFQLRDAEAKKQTLFERIASGNFRL